MRKLTLSIELTTQQQSAIVFFASALDEQLYDFTDDSFKAPALNTFTRTLELQSVAQANHSAGISKDALKPFIEELEASFGKDAALSSEQKALCKFHIASINENLAESDRIARGVSGLRISMGEYFESIINSITEIVMKKPKEKNKLINLTSSFIVQAEALGFPRRHTFHVTQNCLIRRIKKSKQINPENLLSEFFSKFQNKKRPYECIFLCSGPLQKYPKLLEKFKIKIEPQKPDWENLSRDQLSFLDSIQDSDFYIKISTPPRISPAQAHIFAISTINELVGLIKFYAHTEDFRPSKLSLVRDTETNKIYRIHEDPDPMHCWVSHTSASEAEMLEMIEVTHGKFLTDTSANKLRRTLRLHRSALKSNSAENQLIDLWAGLEGLVSRPGKESQRIEYFSECLLPALTLSYPEKIFTSAYSDFCKTTPDGKNLLANIDGNGSDFSKFVRLILCQEQEQQRIVLLQTIKPNPLLTNRLWKLSDAFKNRSEIQQTLRHHRQKVRWHLSRIYHTRNSIMHSASALPYLPTIVENLHVYLDTLIKSIQKVTAASRERQSIDGILQYLSTWEKYRFHALTNEGENNEIALKEDDVWDVVFGQNMALAPSTDYEPSI